MAQGLPGTQAQQRCTGRMSRTALHLLALVAALSLACEAPSAAPAASVGLSRPAQSPRASVAPLTLPRADEAQRITEALTRAGVSVDRVLPSKFDWLFGDAAPRTGTFTGWVDGQQAWADVHFFERPVSEIDVCTEQSPASEWTFTVSVHGQPETLGKNRVTGAATARLFFGIGHRYFVMASDPRILDALRSSLELTEPPCRPGQSWTSESGSVEREPVAWALCSAGGRR